MRRLCRYPSGCKTPRLSSDFPRAILPDEVLLSSQDPSWLKSSCKISAPYWGCGFKVGERLYVAEGKGGRQESTVINYGLRTSAEDAAFVNACFGHGTMGDDTDSVCHAHFGSIIIPAALALGEREGITGRELIKAVVVGYEVSSRIGAAAPLAEARGFHPGPIFGPFGVAACTGVIVGFNENQILDAIGIAGSHASGLMEYSRSGGTVNRLHSSIAAYGGMRAAFLTQRGVKGPPTILEGE